MRKHFRICLLIIASLGLVTGPITAWLMRPPGVIADGFGGVQSYAAVIMNQITAPAISPLSSTPNACATANTSCAIVNFGTGAHWVKFCIVGGTVSALTLELEGSDDQQNWIALTTVGSVTGTNGCGVLEGAGYFKWLRVNVMTLSGTTPSVDVWYSGIAGAIPGGGIILGNKASQPVNFVPAPTLFTTTTLKSAFQSISGSPVVVYGVSLSNPNTSPVFVNLSCNGINWNWTVGANSGRDIPMTNGWNCAPGVGTLSIDCSTAVGGAGDPTSACLANVLLKSSLTLNTQVGSNGTVRAQANFAPQ